MILPTTYWAALLLSIISMLCWGSWANTFKLTHGKRRFELYYFDYSFGLLLTATVAAFTLGQFGTELSFVDNIAVTGKRQMGMALLAGGVFNLANMLLVAAISIAGMAVAFPIGIGLALVIGVLWSYSLNPQGNALLLFSGVALVLLAIFLDAMAFRGHSRTLAQASGKKSKGSVKGIVVSLISGVLMGSFYPLVELSRQGDIGLGPYTIAFFFAIGVFSTTFIFNIYFMNLPIHGKPVEFGQYFKCTARERLLGLAGGMIWCVGAIANFAASSVPQTVQVGPAVSYALGQGATLISALWGLVVWKEFEGAVKSVRLLILLMIVFFVAGLALISLAPLYT
jgi:glucose uptake protein